MSRIYLVSTFLLFCLVPLSAQEFRVQIGAYDQAKSAAFFQERGITNYFVSTDQTGIYRYFAGIFNTRTAADKVQAQLLEKGFSFAFVLDMEEQRILAGTRCPRVRDGVVFVKEEMKEKTERNIYFISGSSTIDAEAKTKLDEIVAILKKNTKFTLDIKGYTDAEGENTDNIKLAATRSRAARTYLIAKGVRADRMYIKVYGEADAAAPNKDDEGVDLPENRKYNRRVQLIIVK